MNQKTLLIVVGSMFSIVALISITLLIVYVTRMNSLDQNDPPPISYNNLPTSSPISYSTPSYPANNAGSGVNTGSYQNNNLPGLNLQYPETWALTVKEFNDTDPKGFQPKYFPSCDRMCMGIRLSKSNVSLNLIFDLAFDDAGKRCSNQVTYVEIGNGWVRVKDSSGYFYSKNYQTNVTTNVSESFNLGTTSSEWSLLNSTTYKICISGTGYFRAQSANVYNSNAEPGTLVENPVIQGSPNPQDLVEIDSIVKTLN